MTQPNEPDDAKQRTARRATAWPIALPVTAALLLLAALTAAFLPSAERDGGLEADNTPETDATAELESVATRPASPADRLRVTPVAFPSETTNNGATDTNAIRGNPLDADRAYGYLKRLCDLGPRVSGSRGMKAQQRLLTEHFESLGAEVTPQRFKATNPLGGPKVRMANLIARWRPDAKRRLLLCAHYDTRPFPDRDPDRRARREGVFVGANDGASGVAALMELAHQLEGYEGPWGVDVVMLDGEELVYVDRRDPYFLGSQWFARQHRESQGRREWEYEWAILLDMVGDADLQLYYERNSYSWPETRPLVRELWETASRLGVDEFIAEPKHEVLDDHLALRRFGGIRAIDVIDFDYPHWHTRADTPDKCSGESLAKVGWVVWEWMQKGPVNQGAP